MVQIKVNINNIINIQIEQDAEYTESKSGKIIDITPPKDKDKF